MQRRIFLYLAGFCLALVALLGVAAGALVYLAGTPGGLRIAVDRASAYLPGTLEIGEIKGGLLGSLELKDISFENDEIRARVDRLLLRWIPEELVNKKFHIITLKASGIDFTRLKEPEPAPEAEKRKDVSLPDIALPVAVALDDFTVHGVKLNLAPEGEPVEISNLSLSAQFDSRGLELSRLELAMPGITAALNGHVAPWGKYPLAIDTSWNLELDGKTPLNLHGSGGISGDTGAITLKQQIDGDIQADMEASASDLLGRLGWKVDFTLHNVSHKLLEGAGIKILNGTRPVVSARAQGDLEQLQAGISLDVETEPCANATGQGREKLRESGAGASAAGQVSSPAKMHFGVLADVQLKPLGFRVTGGWTGLAWPVSGPADFTSPEGGFSASGSLKEFKFGLETVATGRGMPEARLNAAGTGSDTGIELDVLHVETMQGKVDATARVAWKPEVSWDANLKCSGINPEALAPQWPGSVSVAIKSQGKLVENGVDARVELSSLGGVLRGRDLSGNGTAMLSGNEVEIPSLSLGWGRAYVSVRGHAGRELSVLMDAGLPDAAEILPDSTGSAGLHLEVDGPREKPSISGAVFVKDLVLGTTACKDMKSDFKLSLDEGKKSHLELKASGISAGGQDVSTLSMGLNGLVHDHRLDVKAVLDQLVLTLGIRNGNLDMDKMSWRGSLAKLGIDTDMLGNWQLGGPAPVDLSAREVKLSRACLVDGESSLCAKVHWISGGKGDAAFRVSNVSLDRIAGYLPPDIQELSGTVTADALVTLGEVPEGTVNVQVSPGVMTCRVSDGRQVRIRHQGAELDTGFTRQEVNASLRLAMGKNGVRARFSVPRKPLETDVMKAPLSGELELNVRELGLVSAFVPAIEESEGELEAAFTLGGLVGDPIIEGRAVLGMRGPDVSMIGLDVDETALSITANGDRTVTLEGHVRSGKDLINITGKVLLDAVRRWPADIVVTGDNFKVIDIPDALVRLSPDVKIHYSGTGGAVIRGRVTVPEAEITPQEIPAGVKQPSPDVVVASGEEPERIENGVPVDVDLTIDLLDKVHFKGFGVDCFLAGQLTLVVQPGSEPAAHGELRIKKGSFRFYGHDLEIKKGIISYAGGRLDNPGINLLAVRKVQDTEVGVQVTGYADDLEITGYSSDSSISSQDAITILVTGKSKNDTGFSQAAANTAKIAGADMLAQQLKGYTGLDHLDVSGSGENSADTRVFAGKDVTDNLTVGVEAGTGDEGTVFVGKYHLWKGLDFEMRSGAESSGGELLYTIEFR